MFVVFSSDRKSMRIYNEIGLPSDLAYTAEARELLIEISRSGWLFDGPSGTGAPGRNRTADLRFTKPLLYQLSYKGTALRLAYLPRQ